MRDADGACREVSTTWVPTAEVEKVEPRASPGVELSMEALAAHRRSAEEARRALGGLVTQYRAWIDEQRKSSDGLPAARAARCALLL